MIDITKLKEEIMKVIRKVEFANTQIEIKKILSKYLLNVDEIMPEFLTYGENKENAYKYIKIKFSLLQNENKVLWKKRKAVKKATTS